MFNPTSKLQPPSEDDSFPDGQNYQVWWLTPCLGEGVRWEGPFHTAGESVKWLDLGKNRWEPAELKIDFTHNTLIGTPLKKTPHPRVQDAVCSVWMVTAALKWKLRNPEHGVPAVAQWDPWRLGSSETQVQSLAQHSGLRIWYCCTCSSNLIPGPGTPYATIWVAKKEKKKKGKKQSKTSLRASSVFSNMERLISTLRKNLELPSMDMILHSNQNKRTRSVGIIMNWTEHTHVQMRKTA